MRHQAEGPLLHTGPSPAAPYCGWLGQVPAEVGWHWCVGLVSEAGVTAVLDALTTGDRALPGERGSSSNDPAQRVLRTTVTTGQCGLVSFLYNLEGGQVSPFCRLGD
jgi:hypothetical protein